MLISFEINPLKSWNWVEKENANSYYYKKLGRTVNEQKQKKKPHQKSSLKAHPFSMESPLHRKFSTISPGHEPNKHCPKKMSGYIPPGL